MYATLVAQAPVVATVHAYLDRSIAMELAAPILRRIWRRVTVGVAVSEARGVVPPTGAPGGGARDRPERGGRRRVRRGRAPPTCLPDGGSCGSIGWTPRRASRSRSPRSPRCWRRSPTRSSSWWATGKDREALDAPDGVRASAGRHARRGAERGRPRLPRRLRALRVAGRRAGELRDRRWSRRWPPAVPVVATDIPGYRRGRLATESTGCSCRRGTRRRSRPAWSGC